MANIVPGKLIEPNVISHHDYFPKDEGINNSKHIISFEFKTEISEWVSTTYEIKMVYRFSLEDGYPNEILFNMIYNTYISAFIKHMDIVRKYNTEEMFLEKVSGDPYEHLIEKIKDAFPKLKDVDFRLNFQRVY